MQTAGHYSKNRFISMTWPKTKIYQHFQYNCAKVHFYRNRVLKAAYTYLHDQFCKRKPSFMRTYLNPCPVTTWDLHLESVFFKEVTRKRPPRCALLHYTDYIHHVHRPHTFWLLNLPFPAGTFVISTSLQWVTAHRSQHESEGRLTLGL